MSYQVVRHLKKAADLPLFLDVIKFKLQDCTPLQSIFVIYVTKTARKYPPDARLHPPDARLHPPEE